MATQIRFSGPGTRAAELIAELREAGHEPSELSASKLARLDERAVTLVISIPGRLDDIIVLIEKYRSGTDAKISTSEDADV